MRDETSRLLELASTTPGIIVFLLALRERGPLSKAIAEGIVTDVKRGLAVKEILNTAVDAWVSTAKEVIARTDVGLINLPWDHVLEARGSELEAIKKNQIYLIKMASAMVPPTSLWLPPPLWFCPADIPEKRIANRHWFKVMKSSQKLLSPYPGGNNTLQVALCKLVSKNTHTLSTSPRGGRRSSSQVSKTISELYDYLEASDKIPRRESNLQKLLNESREWHQRLAEIRSLQELEEELNMKPENFRIDVA